MFFFSSYHIFATVFLHDCSESFSRKPFGLRVLDQIFSNIRHPGGASAVGTRTEFGRLKKIAFFYKSASQRKVDFVLVFTVVFVHRVFSYLRKMYFRPIFYRGIPASPFSPLRPKKRPTRILIGKTQYFIKFFFKLSSS